MLQEKEYDNKFAPSDGEKYRGFLEHSPVGMVTTRPDRRILDWNRAMEIITELPREEVMYKTIDEVLLSLTPRFIDGLGERIVDNFESISEMQLEGLVVREQQIICKSGKMKWVKTSTFVRDGWIGTNIEDITSEKDTSSVDDLTKLFNRRFFNAEAERLNKLRQYPLCFLMIDVDGLKKVNDEKGHPAGDLLLINVAAVLLRHVRNTDIVARIGGDEFAILLPETLKEDAENIVERIKKECEQTENDDIKISLSIGLAVKEAGENIDLYKTADDRMFEEKNNKKLGRKAIERRQNRRHQQQ